MIQLRGPYQTRPIRFLEVMEQQDWRLKIYGIRAQKGDAGFLPGAEVVARAKSHMAGVLPQPAVTYDRYGVGFLIVHQGEQRNWLLLNWWFDLEILKQRVFSSPLDAPEQITPADPDLLGCIWEQAVHGYERQAWIDTVLKNPEGPDVTAYLSRQYNADI